MPGITDILSFVLTVGLIGGAVWAILYTVRAVNRGVEKTKANLKSKGMDISSSGVSVKTSKTYDREDYLDATQRGIVNIFEASSFRKGDGTVGTPAEIIRMDPSRSGESPTEEKKRHRLFNRKK